MVSMARSGPPAMRRCHRLRGAPTSLPDTSFVAAVVGLGEDVSVPTPEVAASGNQVEAVLAHLLGRQVVAS
jgi:hypothetical protein